MNWLEEFVPVKNTDAKTYSNVMTDTGSKVEGFEILGEDIKNVVVGKIEKMERHENSDHLWVCQVNVGDKTVQIVTGAQNVFEGAIVPAGCGNAHIKEILEAHKAYAKDDFFISKVVNYFCF